MKIELSLSKDEFQKVVSDNIIDPETNGAHGSICADGSVSVMLGSLIMSKEDFVSHVLSWLEIPTPDEMKIENVCFTSLGDVIMTITTEK